MGVVSENSWKRRKWKLALLFFTCIFFLTDARAQGSHPLRISMLTCGAGQDLYSVYGHSAIRIVDSMSGSDIVYNYGTFNFGDPDFYYKFTRGKLDYYLNKEDFNSFMSQYVAEKRSVYEQVLSLDSAQASAVQQFLFNNLKEENRYYKYDFLFDNCSTRIRDLFANLFNGRIKFYPIIASDSVSFRTMLDHYERNIHWERFGINLLMSDIVDRKMNSYQSMFLPDYLMKGFAQATLDQAPLVAETRILLYKGWTETPLPNEPRMIFWALFIIIAGLSFLPKMAQPLKYFDVFLFMLLGILGCFMLFMWLGTEHKVCAWNRNILWAFPLHLGFAFMIPRAPERAAQYARYASWLLIGSLFYSLVAEQKYMPEVTPLILLVLIRLNHYSRQLRFFKA